MEKQELKFSVLMSVYKNSDLNQLKESLLSVINQTIQPDEIIVVVDGPIPEAIQAYLNDFHFDGINLKLIQLDKNQGLGLAMRSGVEAARNELIARMDADDISVTDRFEKQLDAFQLNPDLAIVGGQLDEFAGELDNIVGSRKVPLSQEKIVEFAKYRSPFNHPTVMFKKSALLEVGNYEHFPGLEDYYLWVKMIDHQLPMLNLADTLLLMRVDGGMYSRRGGWSYLRQYYQLKKIMAKKHQITLQQRLISDVAMTVNVCVPTKVRKILYTKVLHR